VGRYLLGWQEDMLRSLIGLAPQGAQVVMQAETSINNPHAQALYRRAGMEAIRYFWRMEIDLDEPPAEAVWPEGIALRTIQPGEDERDVYQVLRAAFKDHWGFIEAPFEEAYQRWRHWGIEREDYDPSLRFLAMDGERIAGACMCLPRIWDDADCGFIATLGVHRDYRKRGLGLALLLHSLGEFHRRGTRRAGLGVDAGSLTGATRLYEKAGMRVAREYATYQKVLREGVDLSTQASGG
jgi:ribosomal protein S18 acetylase RimI-like enzyme